MRALVFIMLGILAATGSAAGADEAAELATLKAAIVGVWKHEHRQFGVEADTLKTYNANGTYTATSKIRMLGTNSEVEYEGKWEILPGPILRLAVTKTTKQLYVPKGEVYVMKDLQMEDGVMTYTHDKKPGREVRQKKAPE